MKKKVRRSNITLLKRIAKKLRKIRNDKKVSQLNVFIDTDIYVSRIENQHTNISISTLADLCNYYGISLKEFFDDLETSRDWDADEPVLSDTPDEKAK